MTHFPRFSTQTHLNRLPIILFCPINVASLHIYTPFTHPSLSANATRLSVLLPKRLPVILFYHINDTCLYINMPLFILFSSVNDTYFVRFFYANPPKTASYHPLTSHTLAHLNIELSSCSGSLARSFQFVRTNL